MTVDSEQPTSTAGQPPDRRIQVGVIVAIVVVSLAVTFLAEYGWITGPLVLIGGVLVFIGMKQKGVVRVSAVAVGAALLASPLIAYIIGLILLFTVLIGNPDLPEDELPYEVQQIAALTKTPDSEVRVADLGGFIDRSYAWRLPVDPDEISVVVEYLGITEVDRKDFPAGFWDAFPSDFIPQPSTGVRYFLSVGFPVDERGSDGDYYAVMYDSNARQIYVWDISNF